MKIRCPKCLNEMQCVRCAADKARGGKYIAIGSVAEVLETVSEWQCPDCDCVIYLSDTKPGTGEPDELDIMG